MKLNFVNFFIALLISTLLSYGLFSFNKSENDMLLTLGGFLCFLLTLVISMGVDFQRQRTTTNIRVVSIVFFLITLVSNLIFANFVFNVPLYIIINGVLILIYIFIAKSIYTSKQ